MAVPTARTDLSTTASSNSPSGSDTIGASTGPDDYLRAHASLIKLNYDDILLKAPLASPTFTGTVTIPTPFTLGAVSVTATGTELNYVDGVTSAIQTQIDLKAPLANPTFTGTVHLPATQMDNSAITEIKTATFNSLVYTNPAGATVINFANGQFQHADAGGEAASLTFSFPGPGVYYCKVTWAGGIATTLPAESSTLKYLGATGAPAVPETTGSLLMLFYDGTNTYIKVYNIDAV